jgi:outer membrane immunogenic protein
MAGASGPANSRRSTGLGIPGAVAAGTIPDFFNLRPEGALGGVQAGYNWQSGRWVFGVETDIQAAASANRL